MAKGNRISNWAFDRFLCSAIKQGTLHIIHADGQEHSYGQPAPGFPDLRIRLADKDVARQIVMDPRLGAAEAYMDGRLVIEQGDVMALADLLRRNRPWERGGRMGAPSRTRKLRNRIAHKMDSFNVARSSRRNVAHHYDVGNDFYRLFLDQRMQYSCAYWPREDMTLDQAQEAKLAHIAAKLALNPGQKVLDIGCGWGGMAIYLAQHADVHVTGITLSQEQLVLARERAEKAGVAGRTQFELIDYRDLAKSGQTFDRIVSVGMFEHVGQPQFGDYFRACANLLAPDGVFLLHTIGRMGGPGITDAFTRKYIFPGGYIPALSETLAASETVRLIAADVEMLRLHYAHTLRAWYTNCLGHREKIEAMYDPAFYRMWLYYLAGAATGFESGGLCNYQILYTRDRRALPITRDWIQDNERALTAR